MEHFEEQPLNTTTKKGGISEIALRYLFLDALKVKWELEAKMIKKFPMDANDLGMETYLKRLARRSLESRNTNIWIDAVLRSTKEKGVITLLQNYRGDFYKTREFLTNNIGMALFISELWDGALLPFMKTDTQRSTYKKYKSLAFVPEDKIQSTIDDLNKGLFSMMG
jgi:hypothetical protein